MGSGSTEISHNTRQQENQQQSSFQDASHASDCVENVKNPVVEILHPQSCIESYVTSEHSLHTILSDLDNLEPISSKPITGIMNQDTILMNTAHQILLPRAIQPIQLQPNIQQHPNMNRFVLNDTEGNPVLITLPSDTKFVTLPGLLEKNNLIVSPVQPEKEVKMAVDNPVPQNDVAVPKTEVPVMHKCPKNSTHMKGTIMNENPCQDAQTPVETSTEENSIKEKQIEEERMDQMTGEKTVEESKDKEYPTNAVDVKSEQSDEHPVETKSEENTASSSMLKNDVTGTDENENMKQDDINVLNTNVTSELEKADTTDSNPGVRELC